MSLDPLYVFLGEVSVQVLCPLFNWIVCLLGVQSCGFFIYFGDQTLVQGNMANIFSHMVGSLFIFLMFSLAVQKHFILMRSHLFILSFMSLALGDILMNILLCGISEIFLPTSFSRTFVASWLLSSYMTPLFWQVPSAVSFPIPTLQKQFNICHWYFM